MSEQALVEKPKMAIANPEQELDRAAEVCTALIRRLKPIKINKQDFFTFEHWQTIARFYNCTVGVDWTKPLTHKDEFVGYESRAVVYNGVGTIISAAEANCTISERNWKGRERFQIKSMAQTRACAKALRNCFAWVAVLGGVQATPAEEIVTVNDVRDTFAQKDDDSPAKRQIKEAYNKAKQD